MPNQLQKLVTEINQYIAAGDTLWRQIAKRLILIREQKLWAVEHKSFKAFVESEWGKKENWAYQLMRSDAVVQELTDSAAIPRNSPVTIRAARAIENVPQEKRAKVVEVAIKNGAITSKSVKQAVEQIVPHKKEVEEDDMGTIIPEECLPIWHRRNEIKELFQKVRTIYSYIEQTQNGNDKLFDAINKNCLYKLESAWQELKRAYPEVVCGACEGHIPKGGCTVCRSTGFQTKEHYKTSIAIEFRRMREASIEERKSKHAAKGLSAASARLNP